MTWPGKLPFTEFVKLNAVSAVGFGLVLVLLNPIGSLFGMEVVAGLEAPWLTGVRAWLVYLVTIPAVLGLFSLLFSAVSYLPTRLLLRVLGGISIGASRSPDRGEGPREPR